MVSPAAVEDEEEEEDEVTPEAEFDSEDEGDEELDSEEDAFGVRAEAAVGKVIEGATSQNRKTSNLTKMTGRATEGQAGKQT